MLRATSGGPPPCALSCASCVGLGQGHVELRLDALERHHVGTDDHRRAGEARTATSTDHSADDRNGRDDPSYPLTTGNTLSRAPDRRSRGVARRPGPPGRRTPWRRRSAAARPGGPRCRLEHGVRMRGTDRAPCLTTAAVHPGSSPLPQTAAGTRVGVEQVAQQLRAPVQQLDVAQRRTADPAALHRPGHQHRARGGLVDGLRVQALEPQLRGVGQVDRADAGRRCPPPPPRPPRAPGRSAGTWPPPAGCAPGRAARRSGR